jgi:hypothetical protein
MRILDTLNLYVEGIKIMRTYTIKECENGWILVDQGSEDVERAYVHEILLNDKADSLKGLLHLLQNCAEDETSRYDLKRVRVICIPGDKFDGKIEGEYRQELEELRDEINSFLDKTSDVSIP